LENPSGANELPPSMAVSPEVTDANKIEEVTQKMQILKDERDANGNGYVEVLMEATPTGSDKRVHQFKIGYMVSNKECGPGKKWQKMPGSETDLGPKPITDTIQ